MTMLGYHPAHVLALERCVRHAADHLLRVPAGDDPLAGPATAVVELVRTHLDDDWMPLLQRIAASGAMGAFDTAGPAPVTRAHDTGVITAVVDAMTPAERRYLQGYVDAAATAVASELSRYDDHGDYDIDHLPAQLSTLDTPDDWQWLAQLHLVEQYHGMIKRGEIELQHDGDLYWIDPFHLVDVQSEVVSELLLAAVTTGGTIRPGGGITRATAHTATTPMPAPRVLTATPVSSVLIEVSPSVYRSPAGLIYGPSSTREHRITHVLNHARPNSTKRVHGVFQTTSTSLPGLTDEVIGIVDEAWARRGAPVPGDPGKYVVPMARVVGTAGEASVTIVVKPGTTTILTAYPS